MKSFEWKEDKEPHFQRRKDILKTHPEVRKLFGIDASLKFKTLALIIIQLGIPFFVMELHWALQGLVIFFVGATISHALFLAIHEITHDLAFQNKTANNFLAMLANIPIVLPYAMAFKIYHAEHHWHQGRDGVDTDLPTETEAMIFKGFIGKAFWMINQILFYAIRPVAVKPLKMDRWQLLNLLVQVLVIPTYIYFAGYSAVIYLLLCVFIAGGLHPTSGHFLSEHYVVKKGQETYSYYGYLNKVTFNVGYHNEHHDFPTIPGSRLPELKRIASDYYDNLHYHTSWTKLMWAFVTHKDLGLFSRVKRRK